MKSWKLEQVFLGIHILFSFLRAFSFLWLGQTLYTINYLILALFSLILILVAHKLNRPPVIYHIFSTVFFIQTLLFGGSHNPSLVYWMAALPTLGVFLGVPRGGLFWLVIFSIQLVVFPNPLLVEKTFTLTVDGILSVVGIQVTLYLISILYQIKGNHSKNRLKSALQKGKNKLTKLKQVLNLYPHPFNYKDSKLKIRWVNESFQLIMGKSKSEVFGKTSQELYSADLADLYTHSDLQCISSGKPVVLSASYEHIDGTMHPCSIFKIPIQYSNGKTGVFSTLLDTTEQVRLLKELEGVTQTQDVLKSLLSHDLRSPSAKSIQSLETWIEDPTAFDVPTWKEIFNDTKTSSEGSLQILDTILQWLKIQSGELPSRHDSVNIVDLLSKVIQQFHQQAGSKNIEIQLILPKGSVSSIDTDPFLLQIILKNILSNSVKFSNDGSIIEIYLQQTLTFTRIGISDQGIGIPSEVIVALNNDRPHPFRYGTNLEKGSSLGLRLVKKLTDKLSIDWTMEPISTGGTKNLLTISHEQDTFTPVEEIRE